MSGQKVSTITVAPGALGLMAGPAVLAAGVVVAAGAGVVGLAGAALREYQEYRREREQERLRREREMLERARERAAKLVTELNRLRGRAQALREQGIAVELPDPPQLPEVNDNNIEALSEFLAANETTVAGYRTELNEALLTNRSAIEAEKGRNRVVEWYAAYAPTLADAPDRRDSDEDRLGRSALNAQMLDEIFGEARKLMAKVDREVVHVSEGLRRQLAILLSADSLAKAGIEKAKLEQLVDEELARTREEKEKRKEELARMQIDRVAALMAHTLEEMGYVVSGTDEAAYVRDGHIFAHRSDRKDHAVRLTIDREARQVATNVVRLVDRTADKSDAGTEDARRQDSEADDDWCGPNGIGRFRQRLGERGVGVNFKRTGRDGDRPVASVSVDEVLDASPSLENYLPRRRASSRDRDRSRLGERTHGSDRRDS